ncbi:MAG: hypothetical protein V4440_02005, partial [Pseudomonadota bacterium]
MPHVYSKLSVDHLYGPNKDTQGFAPSHKSASVLINGRSNVVKPKTLEVPDGVMTSISDEQLALCEADPIFQAHKKNKFITVTKNKVEVEKVSGDMQKQDGSAQLTKADFK